MGPCAATATFRAFRSPDNSKIEGKLSQCCSNPDPVWICTDLALLDPDSVASRLTKVKYFLHFLVFYLYFNLYRPNLVRDYINILMQLLLYCSMLNWYLRKCKKTRLDFDKPGHISNRRKNSFNLLMSHKIWPADIHVDSNIFHVGPGYLLKTQSQ